MACKAIIAAAATALILSFLLPSDVGAEHVGNCPLYRSRVPDCRTSKSCRARCQDEGYSGGFCDGNKVCMCTQCVKDDELQVGQRSSPPLPAPEPNGV